MLLRVLCGVACVPLGAFAWWLIKQNRPELDFLAGAVLYAILQGLVAAAGLGG